MRIWQQALLCSWSVSMSKNIKILSLLWAPLAASLLHHFLWSIYKVVHYLCWNHFAGLQHYFTVVDWLSLLQIYIINNFPIFTSLSWFTYTFIYHQLWLTEWSVTSVRCWILGSFAINAGGNHIAIIKCVLKLILLQYVISQPLFNYKQHKLSTLILKFFLYI